MGARKMAGAEVQEWRRRNDVGNKVATVEAEAVEEVGEIEKKQKRRTKKTAAREIGLEEESHRMPRKQVVEWISPMEGKGLEQEDETLIKKKKRKKREDSKDAEKNESGGQDLSRDKERRDGSKTKIRKGAKKMDATVLEEISVPRIDDFNEMGLDARLLRAVQTLGFSTPTPVQATVIPASLAGRDVLAAAPTGSGKTAAFLIPIINVLISRPAHEDASVRAVVLVPTRELAFQVANVARSLLKYAPEHTVRTVVATKGGHRGKGGTGSDDIPPTSADILVGTPSALVTLCKANSDRRQLFRAVEFIVVDEADLVLSYGYDADTRDTLDAIPSSAQSMLVSATLGDDIENLKRVVLRRPLVIKVTVEDEQNPMAEKVTHNFTVLSSKVDKFLVTYALIRLNVLTGKILVFTNDVNTSFRLKLFLDQFSIRSATLNGELPYNSRVHCVEQFNAGVFDILIANDEGEGGGSAAGRSGAPAEKRNKSKKSAQGQLPAADAGFGLSRGIDFHEVATVLNFDCPQSTIGYTHRAGRTARAGRTGSVLTLMCGESEREALERCCKPLGLTLEKLTFQMHQVESFRYRVEDCLRGITAARVLDARIKDVKREMLASDKLRDFFEENPKDLEALKHDKALAGRVQPHLADVPTYLLPAALRERAVKRIAPKVRRRFRKTGSSGEDPLEKMGRKGRGHLTSRDRFRLRRGIERTRRGPKKAGQIK